MRSTWAGVFVLIVATAMWTGCEKAAESTGSAADAVKSAADSAQTAGADMAATVTAEAQKLLDQATAYVKENKLDSAEPIIKKLEEMKAKLPAEWAAKIAQARSAFDTAKKAMMAMPAGMPAPAAPPAAQ